ncbi:MAG: hypothetical protein WBP44_12840, partial [Gammaproteobacteria bacterium]
MASIDSRVTDPSAHRDLLLRSAVNIANGTACRNNSNHLDNLPEMGNNCFYDNHLDNLPEMGNNCFY